MENRFAQLLLEHSPDALLLLAPDRSISFLNIAAEQLFGCPRARLLGADSGILLAEASHGDFHAVLAGAGAAAQGPRTFSGTGRRADGTELPVEIACSRVPGDPAAGPEQQPVMLSIREVSHRPDSTATTLQPHGTAAAAAGSTAYRPRASVAASTLAAEASVEHDDRLKARVLRDPLTALPNGTLFNERLAAALRRSDSVDILLLNLADAPGLNTAPGSSAGDELLVEVANRLRNCVRPQDTVARLGGNEFVVLLTECLDAGAVATRIADALQEPLPTAGTLLRPGLSMGLASRTGRNQDGAELLREADAAAAAARGEGQGPWLRFLPAMLHRPAHSPGAEPGLRSGGGTGLRRAVELGQISVHYQPVMSPGVGSGPGSVVRFEALARWERHGRIIPPNQFLPVAEQSGLIREIGDEVLRRACAGIRPWLAGESADASARGLAVNVSGLQFTYRGFGAEVLSGMASAGMDPCQLTLELTEEAFFDADSDVLRQLRQLREGGVRIAMDDFGTGYSSLGRLEELPLDEVKIDRSLVAMIKTGREQLPLFTTMISAAHGLGLTVTAEGVETGVQLEYLTDRGCDSLQGYLFAKPAPADELPGAVARALAAVSGGHERR